LSTVTLNAQQQSFAEAYVLGETAGNGTASAIAAGYAAGSAKQIAYKLLRYEGVRRVIDHLNREMIGDYATASIRYLGRLVMDEKAHPKLRIEAAKTLLDRGGYIAPRAPAALEPGQKDIAGMSIAELQAFVEAGKERVAAERRLIDITPAALD
jgi:phage terminase small subunit